MGCGSPQHTSVPANIPTQHLNRVPLTHTQLMQVSNISHPLNVNKKYEHLAKLKDGFTGTGYKKVLIEGNRRCSGKLSPPRNKSPPNARSFGVEEPSNRNQDERVTRVLGCSQNSH